MGRPATYREQDGCHNCAHVFRKWDYDEGYSYFCTFGGLPRPLCGSLALDECFRWNEPDGNDDIGEKDMDDWYEWRDGREVEPGNICDEFAPKTEGSSDAR